MTHMLDTIKRLPYVFVFYILMRVEEKGKKKLTIDQIQTTTIKNEGRTVGYSESRLPRRKSKTEEVIKRKGKFGIVLTVCELLKG